jgi:hypothetical protein
MQNDPMHFLGRLAERTTDACRVAPGAEAVPGIVNRLPFTAVRPGGRSCYPAIWVQDFTMIFHGGFLSEPEGLNHLRLFLQCQNAEARRPLRNKASIPPYAIPDHILLDGRAVFFPGTYSPDDDQGGEPWGRSPPYNNHYDVVWLAHMLWKRTGRSQFLAETIDDITIYERLRRAYDVPRTDPRSGLVYTTAENRAVGFIFCDSIVMTGSLLMASLLRVRASRHMAEIAAAVGRHADVRFYTKQADLVMEHLPATFADPNADHGWLKASTGISAQPDVWGTIYALYLDILPAETKQRAIQSLVAALHNGTIEYEGALRHVPTDCDASDHSAWEQTLTGHNRYQNGAYWHMPVGWLISVLTDSRPELARALTARLTEHMRRNAFTAGEGLGAPWECVGPDEAANQNAVFAPSITVPFSVLSSL